MAFWEELKLLQELFMSSLRPLPKRHQIKCYDKPLGIVYTSLPSMARSKSKQKIKQNRRNARFKRRLKRKKAEAKRG